MEECNRCGECCRVGGVCSWRASHLVEPRLPVAFAGACELLLPSGECSLVKRLADEQGPSAPRIVLRVIGQCDFPELKRDAMRRL